MSRRHLYLIALVFVADAMAVNGRAPRPISLNGREVLVTAQAARLQGPSLI